MKNILLILSIFYAASSYSQTIKGTILDATTNKPVEGVHVYINSKQLATVSNYNGKFRIKNINILQREKDSIYFTHVSYKQKSIPFTKDKVLIYLEPERNELSEVNISQRKLNSDLIYNRLSPMKSRLYSFGSILINDKIYVFGGNSSYEINGFRQTAERYPDLELEELLKKIKADYTFNAFRGDMLIYDINTDTWKKDTLKFRKRANHSVVTNKNEVYVIGGTRISKNGKFEYLDDKIEVFNINDKSLKVDDTNPHQAVNFALFSYKENLILVGGSHKKKKSGKKMFSNKIHLYNTQTGLWYELANMPIAKEAKGVLIDNRIYLFGGYNNKSLKGIESYDLISGKWQKEGELTIAMEKPAITHEGSMVYLYEKGKVLTYNTITKELLEYTIDLSVKDANFHLADNKLYLLGGLKENNYSYSPSGEVFRIDLKEFNRTKTRQSKRL